MPRLVDYAVRRDFMREAAFDVLLRDGRGGVGALSRRSVARALGTSVNTVRRLVAAEVDLVVLAASEVQRRRRHGRLGRLRDAEPGDAGVFLLRKCLPDADARVPEELVWLRLVLATAPAPEDRDRDGLLLRERFRICEGLEDDWAIGDLDTEREPEPDSAPDAQNPLEHHLEEREEMVSALVAEALDVLGCDEEVRPERAQELRALLSGLTLEVCIGRLTPAEAVAALDRTVRRWAPARVAE